AEEDSPRQAEAAAQEDAYCKYRPLLEQLTYNSKRHIDVLTTLAKENMCFTKDTLSLIEAQITKAFIYYLPSFAKNLP
uniref:Uncharacterized protein n=1 Tax=Amazona collaria TaxID=241587 RepID=A0A8B9FW96_9PSIT